MKPSTRLPGFEDRERNAIIAILDLPASAYRDLENSAFNLNQQGLDQLKRESFPFENGIGFLISGIAQQNGAKIYRWSLLAMGIGPSVPNLTMLVNVEVPENALSVYSDAVVRKALASVTFRPAPIQEQLGMGDRGEIGDTDRARGDRDGDRSGGHVDAQRGNRSSAVAKSDGPVRGGPVERAVALEVHDDLAGHVSQRAG